MVTTPSWWKRKGSGGVHTLMVRSQMRKDGWDCTPSACALACGTFGNQFPPPPLFRPPPRIVAFGMPCSGAAALLSTPFLLCVCHCGTGGVQPPYLSLSKLCKVGSRGKAFTSGGRALPPL